MATSGLQNQAFEVLSRTAVTAAQVQTTTTVLTTVNIPAGAVVSRFTAWCDAAVESSANGTIDGTATKYTNDRSGNTDDGGTVIISNSTFQRGTSYTQYGDAAVDVPVFFQYGGTITLVVDTAATTGVAGTINTLVEYSIADPDSLA